MPVPVLLAVASAACFLGLARAAVRTPRATFLRWTFVMAVLSLPIALVAPTAGVALLAPVLFSRRLAHAPIPATVEEWLDRQPS